MLSQRNRNLARSNRWRNHSLVRSKPYGPHNEHATWQTGHNVACCMGHSSKDRSSRWRNRNWVRKQSRNHS
jgi:hypothetical protein